METNTSHQVELPKLITPTFIEERGRQLLIEAVSLLLESGHRELAERLNDVKIKASTSLTSTAGIADYAKREVRISAPIHARDGSHSQLRETILHELGHFVAYGAGHSEEWDKAVRLIGGVPRVYHSMETGAGLPIVLLRPSSERVCDELLEIAEETVMDETDFDRLRVLLLANLSADTRRLIERATKQHGQGFELKAPDVLKIWLNDDRNRFILQLTRPHPSEKDRWSNSMIYGPLLRLIESIPDAHRLQEIAGALSIPSSDTSCVLLALSIPRARLFFGAVPENGEHEMSRLTFDFLVKRFVLQAKRAHQVSLFKNDGIVPDLDEDWLEHPELPLSEYQRAAVMMGMGHDAHALFMDRGTGKTACTVQRLCVEAEKHFLETGKMFRALVVCPNQVRANWVSEIERFATVPGKVQTIRGGQLQRLEQLVQVIATEEDCKFSVAVTGYDSLVANINEIAKVPWDLVVLDESHYIKSSSTKRWKAVRKLRDRSRMRIILTGSPIGNTPMDLWTQLEFLGEGLSGFRTFEAFRRFYGVYQNTPTQSGRGIEKLVALQNMPFLKERLTRLSFQITKQEAKLNLPDKSYDIHEVEMTARQSEVYRQVEESVISEIEGMDLEDPVILSNALVKLLRLTQVTSGFLGHTEGEKRFLYRLSEEGEPNPKIEAIKEILSAEDADPLCKYVIWAIFTEDIEQITEGVRSLGLECEPYYGATPEHKRDEIVKRFNSDPSLRVMVCNPQVAAEGLNLLGYDWWNKEPMCKTYTGHSIFFSMNWSAILRGQAEDRVHRRGTREHIQVTDLVVPGTIDEVIRERVAGKMAMAGNVLDVREILTSLRTLRR